MDYQSYSHVRGHQCSLRIGYNTNISPLIQYKLGVTPVQFVSEHSYYELAPYLRRLRTTKILGMGFELSWNHRLAFLLIYYTSPNSKSSSIASDIFTVDASNDIPQPRPTHNMSIDQNSQYTIRDDPPQVIEGHCMDQRKLVSLLQQVYGTSNGENNFRVEVRFNPILLYLFDKFADHTNF